MNQLLKFGLVLGIICLVATLVLAVTHEVTKPMIDAQGRSEEEAALKQIMPDADSFNKKAADNMEYFEAVKEKNVVGYCIKATGEGYGGYIRMMIGINPDGVIKGVRILEHQETPGLGAKINEVRPGEKDAWFLRQFVGKSARTVEVRKNIDSITGATISSRGVTDAVNKTVTEFLAKIKK